MEKFCITIFICSLCITSLAQSPDPWWERSDAGLPQLLEQGWKISFYITNENGFRREYVLQHATEPGAWHCFWRRNEVFREETHPETPNGVIRIPNGVEHTAYCMTAKLN